ncbi:FAD-dependent monooxygenase [Stigmatella hybrida]|uniref:FAD-dependent monooxygenase n=1 Tax=Stigmatella hybrida TaxID=394097 RepID=UPI001CDAE59D|nr:FAD-dependent monooxygenase [Stigmatella hybrida]
MRAEDAKALVVGGGIGGLAAAIALRQAGWAVEVYEQAPAMGEVGAGLAITTNAMRLLFELGLTGLPQRGEAVTDAEGCTWQGEVLVKFPVLELAQRQGAPSVVIHRAALHSALREAFGPEGLHVGARLRGFEQDGAQVVAHFEGGREARGALLVGADGLRSRVRAQLHGDKPPRYVGYPVWRGITPPFSHPGIPKGMLRETQGRGGRFGMSYIAGDRVFWWAAVEGPAGQPVPGGDKAYLAEVFQTAHAPIPELIAVTDAADILRADTYDRRPLTRWGEGRVTLLGDAAHPMAPNLGQGANSAIEDAFMLALALQEAEDIPSGLRAYEAWRKPRTALLQWQSWAFGAMGHWENPAAVWLRDGLMRRLPRRLVTGGLQRIWGWEPPLRQTVRVPKCKRRPRSQRAAP